jgi:uncharacterized SAM-binding protein YcdF (DUF218 family)
VPPSPSRRRLLRALTAVLGLLAAAAVAAFFFVGSYLAHEDTLAKADAIVVLAGTYMERPLEAADLYREGWAPRIVMGYGIQEPALDVLRQRGVATVRVEDLARNALEQLGIPHDAFVLPSRVHDNTAQEAQSVHALAAAKGWHRIIVVTSKFHLRRAGYAFRRELAGSGVEVVMHGSRYDNANPRRWWATRSDLRWMLSEAPKLAAYWLGLGA